MLKDQIFLFDRISDYAAEGENHHNYSIERSFSFLLLHYI